MTRKPFINEDETLLMLDVTPEGLRYIGESTNLGNSYSLDMLMDEPCDKCFRMIVLNTKTLKSTDVTELFAAAWIERRDEEREIEADDEVGFPDYVRNSMAWARFKDDLEASAPLRITADHARKEAREAVHG